MNYLTPQQVILLALLVAFVTSIATGITTVSLLGQEVEPVTQTINRVVERTIERVVPPNDEEQGIFNKPADKEVVTVVVNQEDAVIGAVDANQKSVVRIYNKAGDLQTFVTMGVIIDGSGKILVDARLINSRLKYIGKYNGGEAELKVEKVTNDALFMTMTPEKIEGLTFSPAKFLADSNTLKLGQSVVMISGANSNVVSTGIVTEIPSSSDAKEINTSVPSENVLSGALFTNLKGEIVGARIGVVSETRTYFNTANYLQTIISSLK